MTRLDAPTLLRELRPDADATPDEVALERLLLEPAATPASLPGPGRSRAPRRRRRPGLRPVALAAALAIGVTVVVAFTPEARQGRPAILERAAAAVSQPDTILHYVASVKWTGSAPRTIESWQTTDGKQERTIYNGGLESVRNEDTRSLVSFNPERNELVDHTDPDYFRTDPARPTGLAGGFSFFGESQLGDPRELLRSAAGGTPGVQLLGPATVDGQAVDRVRITKEIRYIDYDGHTGDPQNAPTRPAITTRDIALSHASALPLRVVDRLEGELHKVVEYTTIEALPRTDANEHLLEMTDHPTAKKVTEGLIR